MISLVLLERRAIDEAVPYFARDAAAACGFAVEHHRLGIERAAIEHIAEMLAPQPLDPLARDRFIGELTGDGVGEHVPEDTISAMADHPPTAPVREQPPPRNRKTWRRIIVGLFVTMIGLAVAIWLLWPDPLFFSRTIGLVVVDETHVSPSGASEVRVFITDGGATGFGGIWVYQRTWTGYQLLWKAAPAEAIWSSHSVDWISDAEISVHYSDPYKGEMTQRILLQGR